MNGEAGSQWGEQLVRSLGGPSLLFSEDGHLLAANDAAAELLGIPSGTPAMPPVAALGSSALSGAIREAHQTRRPVQVDAEVHGRDLQATASVLGNEVLVLVSDRTEQRRVEEVRRNFVVNASHELKTPASAIQVLSEALEVAIDRAPDRVPQLVAHLRVESERLVRLVQDLLDLRQLEEPGVLERRPVDLAALTVEVTTELEARAQEQGLTLTVEVPERARVAGVARELRLMIHNLVANAVQYNRPGGRIDVRLTPDDGAHLLTVADTGIGIPRRDLQRVFERFYRVDVARSREEGGTGLGLSIVRHAVERHGGTVEVDSLRGEGTTFSVRLPIGPSD